MNFQVFWIRRPKCVWWCSLYVFYSYRKTASVDGKCICSHALSVIGVLALGSFQRK